MNDDEKIKTLLAPYRARIDDLDQQIVSLLRQRYDVIEEVGHLKAREEIDSVLQYRVDEVRENAIRHAAEKSLDSEFIGKLYAQLIEHSCNLEEDIIQDLKAAAKKAS